MSWTGAGLNVYNEALDGFCVLRFIALHIGRH